MISWSAVLLTDSQVDSMASSLWSWFSSIFNLLVDFRYVVIALFVFWVIVRFLRKKNNDYVNTWWTESRAVSWSGNKYWSTWWKAKSNWSIRNRFWFK